MLRYIYLVIFIAASTAQATESPRKMGLAGTGRAGISQEAIYSNPAALGALESSLFNVYYGMPRIRDWNGAGKQLTLGAYDGTNAYAKAGFAYERDARDELAAGGAKIYRDRSTYRFGLGRMLGKSLAMGATGRYVNRRDGRAEEKFFDGDIGAVFKAFSDMQAGVTYENLGFRSGELPPIIGAGLHYLVTDSVVAMVDYGRVFKGTQKNEHQWNYAVELNMTEGFVMRGGMFQDNVRGLRGTALGLSWQGPRTSFDYGVRSTRRAPVQREHLFGITVQI